MAANYRFVIDGKNASDHIAELQTGPFSGAHLQRLVRISSGMTFATSDTDESSDLGSIKPAVETTISSSSCLIRRDSYG
jgi:hypothetical protein